MKIIKFSDIEIFNFNFKFSEDHVPEIAVQEKEIEIDITKKVAEIMKAAKNIEVVVLQHQHQNMTENIARI